MEHYRKSSHTTYDLKYHLVWITKYRKRVLTGEVAKRVRELIREICRGRDVEILNKAQKDNDDNNGVRKKSKPD